MTHKSLSLVFSVPFEAKSLPDPLSRFARDVLLAVQGGGEPVASSFRWPMISSPNLDQSEGAARSALAQRIDQCAPTLILFGDVARQWMGEASGRRCLNVAGIDAFIEKPATKRELWQQLQQLNPVASR